MNERTAQRVMRIARELPAGSPLAGLGVAKLSALLTLPEGEREDAAREMDAEHLSSREVEERVRAIRQERDEALRLVGEQKRRMTEIVDDRDAAIDRAVTAERRVQEAARQQEIDEAVQKAGAEAAKAAEERASARYAERLAAARSRIDALEARIADAQRSKTDEEALIRMTALKDEAEKRCAEAEREIDRLCEQLDEQSTQLLRAGSGASGGKPSPATRILSAIGALMAEAGNAPAELARMGGMDADTAQLLTGQAQLIGQWAMQIVAACGGGESVA